MRYCPPNVTLDEVWVNHGLSPCFFSTTTSSIVSGFILLLGLTQLHFYKRYATRHERVSLPRNKSFTLQVVSHFGLVSCAALNVLIQHVVDVEHVYGYEVLDLVAAIVTWSMSLAVIMVERHYQLPAPPGGGHGAILLFTWSMAFIVENLAFLSLNNQSWFFHLSTLKDDVAFGFFVTRYVLTFTVFVLGLRAPGISKTRDYFERNSDQEAILPEGGQSRRSASDGSTWKGFWRKITTLLPYLWPKKSFALQLRVLLCLLLLAGVRVTNVFVPIYYKKIVDAMTPGGSGELIPFCWELILAFAGLKLLQGGGPGQGLLNNLRSYLWISVQQYTAREIQVGLFSHLHSLSLRWHLSRKTGEVLRVMDRGTDSVNNLLSYLIFNILPTLVDIVVAVVYFSATFNIWFGLIVLLTMALYLGLTVAMTEWRTKYRRMMNLADNEQRTKSVDSLLNFETVKYYGAEKYEIERYKSAIVKYQVEEWKALASLALLNNVQSLVMNGGLLVGALYCGYLVSQTTLTVGDFVLFGTYIQQLMVPLNYLGTLYRTIQESFINMENMLDLMDEPQEVKDVPNALPIACTGGQIEFRDVSFFYAPERTILKNISFIARPGETIAFVGATGSGKSTIIRLLFRFYDICQGEILIDGQNIKMVTQSSVRRAIGVVPQDTVLFNETISYNVRYGRPNASDDEVETAATHADIHHRILTFPDGYDTKVGERGLKLSGGEKQRVAIARTLLKAPQICLLDEATSALDTQTERNIQNALNTVCKNRTTLVVAHRLSTITEADCILVLKEGEIIERGRHEELLEMDGAYAAMWNQQSQAQSKVIAGEGDEASGDQGEQR